MPSPYLRSKSVQVSKKASVYAAFHCCRGVQVCPVLVRFPLFLYTCTTMKTPVFMRVCAIVVHFLIPSPGATGFVLSQEGDIRPPFFVYGNAGAAVSAAASVGPERCPPGTRTPCNPGRSWGFTPNPTTFEKVDETFNCLHPTQARAACQPPPRKLRRPKAACATRPAGSPAGHSAMTVTNRAFTSPPQRWPWGMVGLK